MNEARERDLLNYLKNPPRIIALIFTFPDMVTIYPALETIFSPGVISQLRNCRVLPVISYFMHEQRPLCL